MEEKVKVLIINDDATERESCRKILSGHADLLIDGVPDIKEAFIKIKRSIPDVLIFDLSSKDTDGLNFCRNIKENQKLKEIYLIAIGTDDNEVKYIEEGADDFLSRSYNPEELLARVRVGQRISWLLKSKKVETDKMFKEIDVLLIQDGGCAPGYNPVTAFITYHLENLGRQVYATLEGFKSLVDKKDNFVRLVYSTALFQKMDNIPGVFHAAPLSEWRGAQLRSERYKDFVKRDVQKKAAAVIKRKKVKAIIAIGGNGTFKGICELCELLPTSVQVFFIPVTIDSDVAGTDCIGQHTGVEVGAEKIRRYMADARTHKRVYIIEMMGANSGFHALHSCLGSRAHLAVLPNSVVDHKKVADAINKRDECVIVVAEGYKKKERDKAEFKGNAAEYFYNELMATKIKINKRVVCEPFSRDIRGAAPNNLDISLAQRMAYNVASYLKAGTSRLMPAVQSGREYAIPFNEITTDNMKEEEGLMVLSDRLTHG
jgi:6-phosphofructokinase/FixJ family two-component response regulator